MRKLLYVPVIHEKYDLGSLSSTISKRSQKIYGSVLWERHHEIIILFWKSIREFFKKIDPRELEIYQDGLIAEGELGHKIIQEGAKRGSANYQIILDLISRGGMIRKTEDVELLKKELHRILRFVQSNSERENGLLSTQDEFDGDRLMEERDRFIARNINKTLINKGVLFMGAYHQVLQYLADDIDIVEIKNTTKVKDYFDLLRSQGGDKKKFDALSRYMISSVK